MEPCPLSMKGIVKEFHGVPAVTGVDFELRPGEVHALLGINGAGKSTLIKILSGIHRKDGGEIYVGGKSVDIDNPRDAKKLGIATVYQDPQMIGSFTGYENIFLGSETDERSVFSTLDRAKLRERAWALLERFPFQIDLDRPVHELEAVERETIAILRALSQKDARILILDEPTSILTASEIDILFRQIEILKKSHVSMIYITHRLEEVFRVADRFTVLRDGKDVGTYDVNDGGVDAGAIAELMLGEKLHQIFPARGGNRGAEVLKVDDLTVEGKVANVTFSVHKAEILGIFGLVGSGFDELCKSLYGAMARSQGKIFIEGHEVNYLGPEEAVENGLFLIPGDRLAEGQISDESVAFNTTLSSLQKISVAAGWIDSDKEDKDTRRLVETLGIQTAGPSQKMSALSGGNQQKVVIAKALYADAKVYIFEQPTVGVDVGAKSSIYHLIRELAKHKAVIVVSSDCEEVHGICDRAMVLYEGRIVFDKPAEQTRIEEMLLYGLTGGEHESP